MSKFRGGIEHTVVSQNSAVSTKPCIYYGYTIVNLTTGGVTAAIYDATATAQGNLTDLLTVPSGTYNNQCAFYQNGIVMHSGLYVSAIVCTTAADSIIVFYGGL